MKQFFVMAVGVLLAASCSNESIDRVNNEAAEHGELATVPVMVQVSDFSVVMDDFSSGKATSRGAEDPGSYEGVGALILAFYDSEGAEVVKLTQIKSDGSTYTTFGAFKADLPVGTYTMVALGYNHKDGDEFTLSSPTLAAFTTERPRETFCKTQSVTVTGSSALNLSVTLNRISSMLRLISTDGRPEEAKKIRTTYTKGGKSFNPTTGLATVDTGFAQINNPSTDVDATINVISFPFLYSDEETMDITIEALDADENVLFTKIVPNVPMQRNRVTTMTGAVYSASPTSVGFLLETSWIDGNTVNF